MAGFSRLWVYNIKNGQMSHKDDYASTLDLSARTGIKAGGKTIISFDLAWNRSSFFRHEVTVVVERWGESLSPFHFTSVHTHQLLRTEPASGLSHSDLGQRHLPWDCTWENGSPPPLDVFQLIPVFGLFWFALFWFVLFCFVLLFFVGLRCFALLHWALMGERRWKGMPWCRLPASASLLRAAQRHQRGPAKPPRWNADSLLTGSMVLLSNVPAFPCEKPSAYNPYCNRK